MYPTVNPAVLSKLQAKFPSEDKLRDYVASNLNKIERGLVKGGIEAGVQSVRGASARLDILASDGECVVVIEIKRTKEASRQTIHELYKYINLLIDVEGLSRAELRCIVVAVEWRELYEAFSYFVSETKCNVTGYIPSDIKDGHVFFDKVEPLKISHDGRFSPASIFISYESEAKRIEHRHNIEENINKIPGARLAILDIYKAGAPCSIIMTWRLHEDHLDKIVSALGGAFGGAEGYGWPGWEPEEDLLVWVCGRDMAGRTVKWGTPEIYENIFSSAILGELHRYGPIKESSVNNINRIRELLCGKSMPWAVGAKNEYEIIINANTNNALRFQSACEEFSRFLEFCPEWQDSARDFLGGLARGARVHLSAGRVKHFFSRLVQAYRDPSLIPPYMVIEVADESGKPVVCGVGYMSWDRTTCPSDPEGEIKRVHGTLALAAMDMFRRAPDEIWPDAFRRHGILPCLIWALKDFPGEGQKCVPDMNWKGTEVGQNALSEFAAANTAYVERVAELIEQFNEIRTAPSESGGVTLTPITIEDLCILGQRQRS